jgi:hypothetical protein
MGQLFHEMEPEVVLRVGLHHLGSKCSFVLFWENFPLHATMFHVACGKHLPSQKVENGVMQTSRRFKAEFLETWESLRLRESNGIPGNCFGFKGS